MDVSRWAKGLSLRTGVLATGLAFAVACGSSSPGGSDRVCTEIAARVGVGLDIAAPYADRVAAAHMRACVGDVCREADVQLFPSTAAVATQCTGDMCSAQMDATGAKNGFLDIPDMTAAPTRVSLTLRDAAGTEVLVRDVELTPTQTYPNGPECGPAGVQGNVAVTADGALVAR